MGIQLAVAPSVKSPGTYLLVNLLAGQSSPGSSTKRALMIAMKASATGTITADTQIERAVAGPDAVGTLLGPGMLGHLAAKALFAEYGLAQVDLVSPAEPAGVPASATITFAAGPPTVAWTVTSKIAGRIIQTTWAVGDDDTAGALAHSNAINAMTADLPVIAVPVAGVITLTAKADGLWGNDIQLSSVATDGTTGTVTASAAYLAGGTLEFSIANVLLLTPSTEYDLILLCTSNVEAEVCGVGSNPILLQTYIEANVSGASAKLQQMVFGANKTLAAAKTGTDALNYSRAQMVLCRNGYSLPAEWAGAELGSRLREESIDAAANRIEMLYRATLYTVSDLSSQALTDVEVEDALNNGITPVTFDGSGNPRPARPITTYHLDASTNPDFRNLDTSRVTGTDAVAKDIRVTLPLQFAGAKLSEDLPATGGELPPGFVEIKEIKSFLNGRMRAWISLGVVGQADYEEAYENGSFLVRVNPSDASQCDIVIPMNVVPPLAKFSLVVQYTGP